MSFDTAHFTRSVRHTWAKSKHGTKTAFITLFVSGGMTLLGTLLPVLQAHWKDQEDEQEKIRLDTKFQTEDTKIDVLNARESNDHNEDQRQISYIKGKLNIGRNDSATARVPVDTNTDVAYKAYQ